MNPSWMKVRADRYEPAERHFQGSSPLLLFSQSSHPVFLAVAVTATERQDGRIGRIGRMNTSQGESVRL